MQTSVLCKTDSSSLFVCFLDLLNLHDLFKFLVCSIVPLFVILFNFLNELVCDWLYPPQPGLPHARPAGPGGAPLQEHPPRPPRPPRTAPGIYPPNYKNISLKYLFSKYFLKIFVFESVVFCNWQWCSRRRTCWRSTGTCCASCRASTATRRRGRGAPPPPHPPHTR